MRFPGMHLDLVRPGLILYGMIPPGCPDAWPDLRPAMSLKSSVILAKDLPTGNSVSYSRMFTTSRDSRIATIPIGYADGYSRRLSGHASVLIHGQRLPVVGRICMDTCMIDTTELPPPAVHVGDEVVLFGEQAAADGTVGRITVDEVAAWLDTINYEVTCLIGRRVPRAYLASDTVISVRNYLVNENL